MHKHLWYLNVAQRQWWEEKANLNDNRGFLGMALIPHFPINFFMHILLWKQTQQESVFPARRLQETQGAQVEGWGEEGIVGVHRLSWVRLTWFWHSSSIEPFTPILAANEGSASGSGTTTPTRNDWKGKEGLWTSAALPPGGAKKAALHLPNTWRFPSLTFKASIPGIARSNQPVSPKGNQSWIFIGRTDAEAGAPILWPPDTKSWLIGKDPDAGKDWRQEEKGTMENEMVGWHHRLNGHGFEQALGVGEGQGGLVCYSSWGRKE